MYNFFKLNEIFFLKTSTFLFSIILGSALRFFKIYFADGYKIRHKSTFTGPSNWSEYSETYSESYSFSGLVPGDLYRFQVVAKSGDESGDPTEVEFELRELKLFVNLLSPFNEFA